MLLHLNKPALRVLGIAESFVRSRPRSCLAGVVMRGDLKIDGIAFSEATVGGDDATDAVLGIWDQLSREDVNAVVLSGAVISWFNIIELQKVQERLEMPLVCLTYEESPGLDLYIQEHFPGDEGKLSAYRRLGSRETILLATGYEAYIRPIGLSLNEALALLNKFILDGRLPEPVRVAKLAARAALRFDGLEPAL
jgi:hypothetical protein